MSTTALIGLLALLAGIFGGRVVIEHAHRHLSDQRKLDLLATFRRFQMVQLVPLVVLIVGFWIVTRVDGLDRTTLIVAAVAAIAVVLGVLQLAAWRRMRRLDLPRDFRRAYALGRVLQLGGLAVFLALLVVETGGL